ncbi:MAG TPA: prolyl oligopeptidase family serine peptidase [Pyrinomonadaceae bacterium]|nr:prolyl oligopeptidase family serine peptidase [Pyrinomonadaceae bacterium]
MSARNLTTRFARVSLTGLILLACVLTTLGQTGKRELTLEWIHGPEGRMVASVPATAWVDDGTLVILDDRRPPAARTFEKLNPATGQRQTIVDAARALDARSRSRGALVEKQSWTDPARVGVWGWSYGGYMTLNLMTRSQEFKAGISVAPLVDWRYYDTKWTEGAMRTPQENPKGYESTSLIPLAKQMHGRVLIVFGTYDDNVHPYNEFAFIDALIAARKEV